MEREIVRMLKLKKYLKPFILGLIASIVLLFAQSLCDLNLPNYMSDIVNVGIQQNGIENAAPSAISIDGMKMITTFMTDVEKSIVQENYTLVSSTDTDISKKTYKSIYPNTEAEFYIKKVVDEDISNKLDNIFGVSTAIFINVIRDMALQSGSISTQPQISSMAELDIATLYKMQPMFDSIPESIKASAREKVILGSDIMIKQSGIMLAKAFYNELGADIGAMQTAYILKIGMIMILFALLGGVATILVSLLASRIATGVARNLRKDVFDKIESFSNKEFDKFGTASLITRCTNDITQLQQFLQMGIRMIFYAPIMGIGGVIMAVNKSASMSWILGVAVITILGILLIITSIAMPKFKLMQKLIDKLNLVSRENLSGLMVIRAFGTQKYEKKRFEAANADLTNTNLFVNRIMAMMMPVMMIIMNGLSLLIIWVGAHQIAESAMQVGDMMAYMQYAMQVLMSFMMLSLMFIFIPRAAVSATRIADVLETKPSIIDPLNPKEFEPDKKGTLEFKEVEFRYDGAEEYALCDITFTARPGQTTAIIGSTGSGKSTIASLAMRFYDVTGGQILLDGIDVREVTQKDLRAKIGFVPQEGVLLSGTIAFNLKYGHKESTDKDMEIAASIAQATEFINERPELFDSQISQGATNVSGGQKQRLSIARALTKKPEILIFDDSFSALDFKTDITLRRALKEHVADSTIIIIAQRVSSIMNAEQIIVLDKGKIVGHGTHQELLKDCKEYREIASSQLGEGEMS